MIVLVGGVVGVVGIVGTVAGASHEDYSDLSEWPELSPREKYRKEIRETEYTIKRLNTEFKEKIKELCYELGINEHEINIPDLETLLEVDADSRGVKISGWETLEARLRELNEKLFHKVSEEFQQRFEKEINELLSRKKRLIELINRINTIKLYGESA